MSTSEIEKYGQNIAAMKIRTRNKKGRYLPAMEAIRLIEQFGIETPQGMFKNPKKWMIPGPSVNNSDLLQALDPTA